MPVIALQGIRGGVGTTSVTAGLAWALYALGESVLVIDFSPDNLLRLHFNMPHENPRGWARAEIDGEGWNQGAMQYCDTLAFLPFGQVTPSERQALYSRHLQAPTHWQYNLAQLNLSRRHADNPFRWILLDIPAGDGPLTQQLLATSDHAILLLTPDANCHARLHQQTLPAGSHLLINQFSPASQLQHDLNQLWSQTLHGVIPVVIHRDEAMAESMAMKQPVGEYRPDCMTAEEITTLANWCLIHCSDAVS